MQMRLLPTVQGYWIVQGIHHRQPIPRNGIHQGSGEVHLLTMVHLAWQRNFQLGKGHTVFPLIALCSLEVRMRGVGPGRKIATLRIHEVLSPLLDIAELLFSSAQVVHRLTGNIRHTASGSRPPRFVHRLAKMQMGHRGTSCAETGGLGGYLAEIPLSRQPHHCTAVTPPPRWAQPGTTVPGEPSTSLSTASSTATGSGPWTRGARRENSAAMVVSSNANSPAWSASVPTSRRRLVSAFFSSSYCAAWIFARV